jgi:hypothetical protein
MSKENGGVIVRLGESADFLEVDGWRRTLEHAGIRSRLAQQNSPYFGSRYILYVFEADVDRAVRVLGWVPDPSEVDPVYAEDAVRRRLGLAPESRLPRYLPIGALILLAALVISLLAALLS